MILSILWYLLVRDVIFEDFNDDELSEFSEENSTEIISESRSDSDNELDGGHFATGKNKESYVCLVNNGKYLVVNPKHKLEFGRKASNAIFKIIDQGKDTIQLESLKYPGYYLYYDTKPCLKTDHLNKKPKQTQFIPMGFSKERKITLIPDGKNLCLENKRGSPIFGKYSPDNLRSSQLFKVETAHVTH